MANQTITAFYDNREHANNAAQMLRQAGIPNSDITVSPESPPGALSDATDPSGKGFWASLDEMFGGSDDHGTYAEGIRRGGTMIVAHVDDAKVEDAIRILEQHGSIDLDERETSWRSEGWTGAPSAPSTLSGSADTLGMASPALAGRRTIAETDTRSTLAGAPVASSAASSTGKDEVLQVVEEQLNVGKRSVNRGKVRVHSYVVETPVSENVTLRDETVSIDRRPVDRTLGIADLGADAFQERTIEMDETDEEAVVSKSTRVVEEIGLRKDVQNEVRTISDSVRSTRVDIEDGRAVGSATSNALGFASRLVKDMEVVGSDGQHVGVIDHVDGGMIKLKKMDPASAGTHHLIPAEWVQSVDRQAILKTTASDAKSRWTAA